MDILITWTETRFHLKGVCLPLCVQDNMVVVCGSRAHLEEDSIAQVITISSPVSFTQKGGLLYKLTLMLNHFVTLLG